MHRFLTYRNGLGIAQCGDVTAHLRECPRLPGMRFIEIEYFPRIKARTLSEDSSAIWRDMTEDECKIADSALYRMHAQALGVFS